MDFQTAIKTCLNNYANFNGRARRSEFWYFFLFTFLLGVVASIIDAIIGISILQYVVALAVVVPSLAVGARRLHDTDRSGWLQLISLIPLIGTIILIVFWAGDSKPGDNKYGPNPKGQAGAYGQPGGYPGQAPYAG